MVRQQRSAGGRRPPSARFTRPWKLGVVLVLALLVGPLSFLRVQVSAAPLPPPPLPPSARLYVGHAARLTTWIPAGWVPAPGGAYEGPDGFIDSGPLPDVGPSLEEACRQTAADPSFGSVPTTRMRQIAGREVCQIAPSGDQPVDAAGTQALIVRHPDPFESFGMPVEFVAVYADADHLLSFAARLDFDLAGVPPAAYLASAIDLIAANSYFRNEVDWAAVRADALARAEDAESFADTYPAIEAVYRRLRSAGDDHSIFLDPTLAAQQFAGESVGLGFVALPDRVVLVYPDGPAERAGIRVGDVIQSVDGHAWWLFDPATWDGEPVEVRLIRAGADQPSYLALEPGPFSTYLLPVGRRLPGDVGYVELFGTGGDPEPAARYATTAQEVIAGIDAEPTCGWVIDLRRNLGGSFVPMVTGVGSILGEGEFLGFVDAAGTRTAVEYRDGRVFDDGLDYFGQLVEGPLYELKRPLPPVAVLIGPGTASSGEITAIAFVGRPQTRLFGERSAGFTTANEVYELIDGAWLVLATLVESDRTGAVYTNGLTPDQYVGIDWAVFGADEDPVLQAAVAWLEEQGTCIGAAAGTAGAEMRDP
jgi:C-terminal processing protease CtpA/Prc